MFPASVTTRRGKPDYARKGRLEGGAKDNWMPETTVELALNDGEISGTAHLAEGSNRAAIKQEISTEIYPVPYIFCASKKPESADEERALKEAFSNRYDAWYTINDAKTFGRELEKAINGWLFDRQVTERRITKRYGWVSYYEGDRPEAVADIFDEKGGKDLAAYLFSMQAWFNKRKIYEKEAEYRYAYVIESPQADCIFLDLTSGEGTCGWTRNGCVSKVVEIGFGASPSGLSFAAVRPRGQGFRRRLADRGFPIHRLCASGFGRKRGAPRVASALFRDTAARSVF